MAIRTTQEKLGGAGGGTPGGSDTQIQFNDGGAFGGDSALTWDKTSNAINLSGDIYIETTDLASDRYISVNGQTEVDTNAGDLNILGGQGNGVGKGSDIAIFAGNGGTSGDGGLIDIRTGDGGTTGNAGYFNLQAGEGKGAGNVGGAFYILSGGGTSGANSGDIQFTLGQVSGGGTKGKVKFSDNGSQVGILDFSSIATTDKTFTFPNATGTIALTSNIPTVSDTAYDATSWNGNTDAPTKNAVRDKFESLSSGGQTLYDAVVASSGGDYTTLQDAITGGAKNIFVRDGTYALVANFSSAATDLNIVGENRNTSIISLTSYNLTLSGANVTVQNLKITETTGSFTVSGAYSNVLDCEITASGVTQNMMNFSASYGVFENNNVIDTAATAISAATRANFGGQGSRIANNYIKIRSDNTRGCFAAGQDSTVVNNVFESVLNVSNKVFVYAGGQDQTFSNNRIIGSVGSYVGTMLQFNNRCTANNNLVTGGLRGIDIVAQDCSINNNWCLSGSATYPIYIQAGLNSISNNYVKGGGSSAGRFGIYVASGDSNIIASNQILDTYDAVYIASGCNDNAVLANNVVSNCGNKAINDLGTRTRMEANTGLRLNDTMISRYTQMKNTSGGALAAGDLVVWKAVAAGDEVTTTATAGDDKVYGMATAAISNNAYGTIQTLGKTTLLKVDGTTDIAVGDPLTSFTTAGIACKASAGDMVFAYALEAYTGNDSNGVIDALLINPRLI